MNNRNTNFAVSLLQTFLFITSSRQGCFIFPWIFTSYFKQVKTYASEAPIHVLCEFKGLDSLCSSGRHLIIHNKDVSGKLVKESTTEFLLERRHAINTDFNYGSS